MSTPAPNNLQLLEALTAVVAPSLDQIGSRAAVSSSEGNGAQDVDVDGYGYADLQIIGGNAPVDFSYDSGDGNGDGDVGCVVTGHLSATKLYRGLDIGVDRLIASAQTEIRVHANNAQHMWFGVISGRCIVTMFSCSTDHDVVIPMGNGGSIYIEPGCMHSVFCPEDTVLWVLSMPPTLNFPFLGK